jgi:hypothetical protein
MKRSPTFAAILAASAITLGSAGAADARDSTSALHHDCVSQNDEQELSGGMTCAAVDQAPPPDDLGVTPAGQAGIDAHGTTIVGQAGQAGQAGTDELGTTVVDQTGSDGQTMPNPDEGPSTIDQNGTEDQTEPQVNVPGTSQADSFFTDDQLIQTADDGAQD